MEADAHTATALLTEHLQYTPLSLIDDIINSVNNFVYQGIGSLETGLFSTPPERLGFKAAGDNQENNNQDRDYPDAKQEIEEGLHKLETLLNSTVDKNFDKFEIYVLRNILSVPADLVNWVRLSHYENVSFPPSANAPSMESIQLLRQKLTASRTVTRALLHERRRNELVLERLKALLNPPNPGSSPNLSFLFSKGNNGGPTPTLTSQQSLNTNVNFALSQLPALQALLAELRPKLAMLRDLQMDNHTAKDEMREERRGYIEQRTRAHLDRNGRSLDSNSHVVDGKRPDADELRALEKLSASIDPP